ncbi:hypothetical protein DV738_g934, partial [Chaetothyriales sp. CBS 135597]
MLRLGAKDRSSFLFKRLGLHNSDSEDGSSETKAAVEGDDGPLPAIAHIDTESFVDFFDRFQSLNANEESNVNAFSRPANSSAHSRPGDASSTCAHQAEPERKGMLRAQTAGKATPTSQPSNGSAVARNDSTGSSSTTLSTRSTHHSSSVTRNSSASSFTDPPSPVVKQDGPRRWSRSLNNMDRPSKQLASTTSVVAQTRKTLDPDLDYLHLQRAELESTERMSQPSAYSGYWEGNQLQRSVSLTRAAENRSIAKAAELPSSPQQKRRGAQTTTAVAQGRQMPRSRELFSMSELDSRLCPARQAESHSRNTRALAGGTREPAADRISASAAENIIYRIMYYLTDVKDLQSATLVSKGFMNTFKRNETTLVSHLMHQASKPAWELRRNILLLRRMKEFRMNDYVRDLRTITGLKLLILDRCRPILSPKTITGLTGEDRASEVEVENGLWRIWSFCVLFSEQAHEPLAGLPWLNGRKAGKSGSAGGNADSLSSDELDNVLGTWMCLQRLLSQIHGRQDEADRAGVFDNWSPALGKTKDEHLQEWTAYLLSLGPGTVFEVCSAGDGLFESAESLGLTDWPLPPPGQTRSNFLTSTISHIYQEPSAFAVTGPVQTLLCVGSTSTVISIDHESTFICRIEIRPDCDPEVVRGRINRNSALFPATASNDPTLFHTLTATTTTASAKLGATLFPVNYTNETARMPARTEPRPRPQHAKVDVVDPVDQHLSLLVHQLGFDEVSAKRALAMSDTGSGIDVRRAIEVLVLESKATEEPAANTPVELPTPVLLPNTSPQMTGPQQAKRDDKGTLGVADCKPHAKSSPLTTTGGGGASCKPGSGLNQNNVDDNLATQNQNTPTEEAANEEMGAEMRSEQLDVVPPLTSSSSMPLLSNMRCISPLGAGDGLGGLRHLGLGGAKTSSGQWIKR